MNHPSDTDILNAMRTGCRSAPDLVKTLYNLDGHGTARQCMDYRNCRVKMNARLNSLARYGFVRKVGIERTGGIGTMIFEVIE